MRAPRWWRAAPVVLAAVVLAGCSGVPSSSRPQVVGPVGVASSAVATITPSPGDDQRTIVRKFLDANVGSDTRSQAARTFLTQDASTRWSSGSVTIVQSLTVGVFDTDRQSVTASGGVIATVDSSGVYHPVLRGTGTTGEPTTFTFSMRAVSGQWRINQLAAGLIITEADFASTYRERSLYFMDLSGRHLIPDVRYTSIVDPEALAAWLLAQLVDGPRPDLTGAVQPELPDQADPRRVQITTSSPPTIEVPGTAQLSAVTQTRLAAQVAETLGQAFPGQSIGFTDSGTPVSVAPFGTHFDATDFQGYLPTGTESPALYYVRSGALIQASGQAVTGPLGQPSAGLTSVAMADRGTPDYEVAATVAASTGSRLEIGDLATGRMRTSTVPATISSRPSWAVGAREVWIAAGGTLYRVDSDDPRLAAVPVTIVQSSPAVSGQIIAVDLSPDGTRIALVLQQRLVGSSGATTESQQAYVGAVVRGLAQVTVDNLLPVTPPDVLINDIAWQNTLTLVTTGAVNSGFGIWSVVSDGSLWTARSIENLPTQPPDAIAAADGELLWVSVDQTVWVEPTSSWASPGAQTTYGTAPTYVQ